MDLDDEEAQLLRFVQSSIPWRRRSAKALVRVLHDVDAIEKDEVPQKPSDATLDFLANMHRRHRQVVEKPLERYARNLKPTLFRRVHVGTMDIMDESHEAYRKAFDFLETTNTWHDTHLPWHPVSHSLAEIGCGFQPASKYKELARRARDGFKMVVKISHVATHVKRLANFDEWWPVLYKEKYRQLEFATAAYLWQFPPSFQYERDNFERLEALVEYLHSSESGVPEARHIVDFRHGSWYNSTTYEFLRNKRWCLAWLHLNNEEGWAGDLPSGWTDRVQTTNFCFMRLFGPSGRTHGRYDKAFLHQLFDSCPAGATSFVLFGNREELDDENPNPRPAVLNANDFRTIFTKMDFVERIRAVRYVGECPRPFTKQERLLLNSFYLRFSNSARLEGLRMSTLCGNVKAQKYYPDAPADKRSFEWRNPRGPGMLHLSLHEAREDEDLWMYLRQLSGLEDLEATREWVKSCVKRGKTVFGQQETELVNGAFLRWSERARQAGLLRTTKLDEVRSNGLLCWRLTNGVPLRLSATELSEDEDVWKWFIDLSRVALPEPRLDPEGEGGDANPWKTDEWRKNFGEMWTQEYEACVHIKPGAGVPDDYKAASLLFYSRDEERRGEVSRVLLGIEYREVEMHTIGRGAGKGMHAVLVFPQGKREELDENYVATALREFKEETGDTTGLAKHLEDNEGEPNRKRPAAAWYQAAKMAIVFCEVPAEETKSSPPHRGKLPLRPVWVDAADLRKAVVGRSSADLRTDMGSFPLFNVVRGFLRTTEGMKWLESSNDDLPQARKEESQDATNDMWGYVGDSWAGKRNASYQDKAWGQPAWKRQKEERGAEEPDLPAVQLGDWKTWKDGPPKVWSEWTRWESNSKPGTFLYMNTETKEQTADVPPVLRDTWELRTGDDSAKVYYNKVTGESQAEAPPLQ